MSKEYRDTSNSHLTPSLVLLALSQSLDGNALGTYLCLESAAQRARTRAPAAQDRAARAQGWARPLMWVVATFASFVTNLW